MRFRAGMPALKILPTRSGFSGRSSFAAARWRHQVTLAALTLDGSATARWLTQSITAANTRTRRSIELRPIEDTIIMFSRTSIETLTGDYDHEYRARSRIYSGTTNIS